MISTIIAFIILGGISKLVWDFHRKSIKTLTNSWTELPPEVQHQLQHKVDFYQRLTVDERIRFEEEIVRFLSTITIRGVHCKVTDFDKILVASSAIIPLFAFKGWTYNNLDTVILLPNRFDFKFNTQGPNRNVIGLVGTGKLDGVMHLSQKHLRLGYSNKHDRKNVGIHEFIHLLDLMDGDPDGMPGFMIKQPAVIPWINHIHVKIEEISKNRSDIRPYGATNKMEFFSVASEYFFESPRLLKKKHPKLYQLMSEAFNHDYASKKMQIIPIHSDPGRNDPCPCGSGDKYKKCCLN